MKLNIQNQTSCENGMVKNKTKQNKTKTKTRKTHRKQH